MSRPTMTLRRLMLYALGGAGIYIVGLVTVVAAVFVPRIGALRQDTERIIARFESFAATAAALDSISTAAALAVRARAWSAAQEMLRGVEDLPPSSFTSESAEVIANAPVEMRRSLALAIDTESDVRDLLGEAAARAELGQQEETLRTLASADSVSLALVAAHAEAQQAGLRDVARRGAALEAVARGAALALLVGGALGVLGLGTVTLLVRHRLYVPLQRLDSGMTALASGELGITVPVRRDDELGRLAAVFNRTSEMLRSREAERRSERSEMTRRILESARDAVVTIDLEGRITGWNPGAESLFGWLAPDALGRELAEIIVPHELRARHREGLAAYRQSEEAPVFGRRIEMPALRRDGTTFTSELSIIPIVEEGRRVAYTAFLRDVTEARRAEEALRQSEALLRSVLDNTTAVITIKDLEGRYRLVNRMFTDVFGVSAEDAVGRTMAELVPEQAARIGTEHDRDVVRTGQPAQFQETLDLPDGDRQFISVRFPLLDEDGEAYAIGSIATDVTDSAALEEQVRRAQRLEAVGRLAGGIAHDFNNLVTVIMGQAQLALEAELPQAVREGIQEIERASTRAASLTGQLLSFARRQIIQPRIVPVNELVSETVGMIHRVIEATVRLETELASDAGSVSVDPGQFTQVVLNLVMNAREAMGADGGVIGITTHAADPDEIVRVPDLGDGSYVELRFTDTGPGIPESITNRLFEPFTTTKPQGTGLGLATCHGIVKQAGGTIVAGNRPQGGAEFRVYLPSVLQGSAHARGIPRGAP